MKIILYTLSALLICTPLFVWIGIKVNTPEDVIVHDTYMGVGSFTTSPRTFACLSIAIGFIILATNFHRDYKKSQIEETINQEKP